MTNPDYHAEANRIAARTFVPKAKNIARRLDDAGFRGRYVMIENFDTLTIKFYDNTVVIRDLSSELTDKDHFEAIMFEFNRED